MNWAIRRKIATALLQRGVWWPVSYFYCFFVITTAKALKRLFFTSAMLSTDLSAGPEFG